MSSILDALNKSEAERRSAPPGLNTPIHFAGKPPPRRRKSWLLPVLAVAALALAWAGGLFDFGSSSDDQIATDSAAANPAEPASPDVASLSPPDDAAGDAPPAVDPQPAPVVAEAPPARRRGGFGPHPAPAATSSTDAAPAPTDATAVTEPSTPAPAASAPLVPPPQPVAEQAPSKPEHPETTPATTTPPPPAQQTAQPVVQAAPATAANETRGNDGIPSLNDLPFATRKGLPALSLTMHLYGADPARRMILLNGVQARDGDELEGGIQIRAIRPDGVVIVYEGTEFVLPARN